MRRISLLAPLASIALLAMPTGLWAQQGPPQERYIVGLVPKGGIPETVAGDIALRAGGRVGYVYEHALKGFSITMPRAALAGVRNDPRVAYIEKDLPVSIVVETLPTGVDRAFAPGTNDTISSGSPIDEALSINGVDDLRVDAAVAVLDTGIDREHPDLKVVGGANCLQTIGNGPPWARSYFCDDTMSGDDDHYHGTHVAGTIGALDNDIGVVGVAPGVRLYAVKVLDSSGSGYTSGILAGIDWVVQHGGIDVINMSLGGSGVDQSYETAIANANAAGVTVVVAAGNSDADANFYSPAFAPHAITVSALADFDGRSGSPHASPTCRTDQDDTLADFSNWGTAVDIAAPGVCITSTYPIEKGSYGTISGTSMASPHVAGAAALLASTGMTVAQIRTALLTTRNNNWTDDSGDGVKEPLLDISSFAPKLVAAAGNLTNSAPTASFTASCTNLACDFNGTKSSDSDGTIATWAWNFGDTSSSAGSTASHSYAVGGTYTVALTVTDNVGASGTATQDVTVSSGTGGGRCAGKDATILLTPSATNQGKTWTANVDVVNCVEGSEQNFMSVTESWSAGQSTPRCTTSLSSCTETLTGIRKNTGSVTFTINTVSVDILKP